MIECDVLFVHHTLKLPRLFEIGNLMCVGQMLRSRWIFAF